MKARSLAHRGAAEGKTKMPRIDAAPRQAIGDLNTVLETVESRMGFVPNSQLILAHRPEILRAFAQLGAAINGPSSTISPQLRNLVSQMASRAAGCGYCMAHTTHTAARVGISAEKEDALWSYETSPLFSEAERAALRVAQGRPGAERGHRRGFCRAEEALYGRPDCGHRCRDLALRFPQPL